MWIQNPALPTTNNSHPKPLKNIPPTKNSPPKKQQKTTQNQPPNQNTNKQHNTTQHKTRIKIIKRKSGRKNTLTGAVLNSLLRAALDAGTALRTVFDSNCLRLLVHQFKDINGAVVDTGSTTCALVMVNLYCNIS